MALALHFPDGNDGIDPTTNKAWGHPMAVSVLDMAIRSANAELKTILDDAAITHKLDMAQINKILENLGQFHLAIGHHYMAQLECNTDGH